MKHVLVTGATGKIGRLLIERLAAYPNIRVRALVRNAQKGQAMMPEKAGLVIGDFENIHVLNTAVMGVDLIVLITPANQNAAIQARNVLAAAEKAGVNKIIRISVFNAAINGPSAITQLHGHTDAAIQNSGINYTILRPIFFMQNLFFIALDTLVKEQKLYFGTGDAKLSIIDLRDIVDCAEQCILSNAFDNQVYTLTGPECIRFYDIVNTLSSMLNYPMQYVSVPPEVVKQFIRSKGMS